MWIVRLALRRPYTFVVMAVLILIMGSLAILRTPTDIFPNINIPVISIIWSYNGLVPEDMSDRIVSVTERALTTTVDNIEHIESQSLYGTAVVKVFLQPTANIQQGIAQITAVSQTQLRQLPPGTTPPLILAYSASSVPVLQLALSGQNLSEQQLVHVGGASGEKSIDLPGAGLRSSAIVLMGSGAKSARSSALVEAIKSVFKATIPARLQIATKIVPLSEVEEYWSAPGKPRVVFTLR
jgi:hypothetical protein